MYFESNFKVFLTVTVVMKVYTERSIECPKLPTKCFCYRKEGHTTADVECKGAHYEELQSVFMESKRHILRRIEIASSNLTDVNHSLFSNVTLRILHFKSSNVEHFHIFEGFRPLKDLKILIIDDIAVKNWIFTPADAVSELSDLEQFSLLNCQGNSSNDSKVISYLPRSIKYIKIRWCNLNLDERHSVSRYSKLRKLDFSNNELRTFTRSYLPNPAQHFEDLRLSSNPITLLPSNLFEGMPNLKSVNLERMYLTELSYETFRPVLRRLKLFKITYNPLHCDCFSSWLLTQISRWKRFQMPTCLSPEKLKNRRLDTIPPNEMCHQEGYEKAKEKHCAMINSDLNQTIIM